jgi:tRNA threonylcarbamoyladenosine biosynthesis protein TsaE
MDLYRLGYDDLEELGLEDYLYGNGICVIEWPDRLEDLMPANRLHISLKIKSEGSRTAILTAYGNCEEKLAEIVCRETD